MPSRPTRRGVDGFVRDGDCYSVTHEGGGKYLVRHYPDWDDRTRPCCQVRVTHSAADRAKAIPDADPHGVAACLHRAYLAIEKKHAGGGPT